MHLVTQALVLREVDYKEADKILTLFSKEHGKITAEAKGCRRKGSLLSAGCQQLVFSQFVLQVYRGRYKVLEVAVDEEFKQIPKDLPRFALACYFADVIQFLALEELAQEELLALMLNCLYVLDKKQDIALSLVKAVFELRSISISGYQPMLEWCSFCENASPKNTQFSFSGGAIHCFSCGGRGFPLSDANLNAMRFITQAESKDIFSFSHSNPLALSELTEGYLSMQLAHSFKSLAFYKKFNLQ